MAERTAIGWTRSTFNPWVGCTKVGPGCDLCYAEALDARHQWGGATHWGAGVPRMRTSQGTWNAVHKWNKQAAVEQHTGKLTPKSDWTGSIGFWPVFCASLADVFDNEIPGEWREDLWRLVEQCPHLTWQLVTKRVGNVIKMVPPQWLVFWPRNIWIIATMVNQAEFDRDWPKLREIPARVRGLSVEPMLGPIEFPDDVRGRLHWVIYGGESTQKRQDARECRDEWILDGLAQCAHIGIAAFVKQGGSNYTTRDSATGELWHQVSWSSGKNAEPANWPAWMQVQEFPRAA